MSCAQMFAIIMSQNHAYTPVRSRKQRFIRLKCDKMNCMSLVICIVILGWYITTQKILGLRKITLKVLHADRSLCTQKNNPQNLISFNLQNGQEPIVGRSTVVSPPPAPPRTQFR